MGEWMKERRQPSDLKKESSLFLELEEESLSYNSGESPIFSIYSPIDS